MKVNMNNTVSIMPRVQTSQNAIRSGNLESVKLNNKISAAASVENSKLADNKQFGTQSSIFNRKREEMPKNLKKVT